jgi:hypothetical protein
MKNTIASILKKISEQPERDIVPSLKANDNIALRAVLVGMFHPGVNWTLPAGKPPYTPSIYENHGALYRNYTKFKYFVAGGEGDRMIPYKRERIFVDLIETLNPDEAELVIAMKDKINPYPTITYKHVAKAFPGLLPNEKKV